MHEYERAVDIGVEGLGVVRERIVSEVEDDLEDVVLIWLLLEQLVLENEHSLVCISDETTFI